MLQQQHSEHDLSRRCFAATSLALLAAFGQLLLDDEQQGVIFQRRIGVPHPKFPEVLHPLADEAIVDLSFQSANGETSRRSSSLASPSFTRKRRCIWSRVS